MPRILSLRNALIVVLLVALYLPGFIRIKRSYTTLRHYRQQIPRIAAQNQSLNAEKIRLRTDPFLTEQLARQELGLIRENEHVIKIREGAESDSGYWRKTVKTINSFVPGRNQAKGPQENRKGKPNENH